MAIKEREAIVPIECDSCGYSDKVYLMEIPRINLKKLGIFVSSNDRWYTVEDIIDGETWFHGKSKNETICDECYATSQFEQDYDPRSEALTPAQRNPGGV